MIDGECLLNERENIKIISPASERGGFFPDNPFPRPLPFPFFPFPLCPIATGGMSKGRGNCFLGAGVRVNCAAKGLSSSPPGRQIRCYRANPPLEVAALTVRKVLCTVM